MKKVYVKEEKGYVVDLVENGAELENYKEVEVETFPSDIMNQCYKLVKKEFILDEEKLAKQKAESREGIITEFLTKLLNEEKITQEDYDMMIKEI